MISGFDWKYWENEIIQLSSELIKTLFLLLKTEINFHRLQFLILGIL